MKKRDKDDPMKKLMTRKEPKKKKEKNARGKAHKYYENQSILDKYLGEARAYRMVYYGGEDEVVGKPYETMAKSSVDAFNKAKAQMPKGAKKVVLIVNKRSIGKFDLSKKLLGEGKGKGMKYAGLAKEVKKKYGKTVTIDKLSHMLAVDNIHPDDHMPDVEDALNRIGVKVMPSWSTKKTKVGDKPGRKKIKKAGKYGMTVEKYLGEGMPTVDYKKIQGNDWIIYDEGTGEIQKVVKAGKNTDPKKHFVSSKSAAVVAHTAATKMAYLFVKKNKGFNQLVKTMALGAKTDLVPASGGAKFVKRG